MKLLSPLLLLLLLGVWGLSQNVPPDGSGLVTISKKWHRELRNPVLDHDLNDETADLSADDIRRRPIEQTNDTVRTRQITVADAPDSRLSTDSNKHGTSVEYVYEIKLRNESGKDVSSVTWEYVFVAPDSGQEVGRRRFTSREPIPNGKSRTLLMHSASPPTGTIDVSKTKTKTPETYTEKIVFVSVEYTDKSKWSASNKPG